LLYTKILEGLQQKLEGLEPISPIVGAATGDSIICLARYMLSPVRLSIRLSVCLLDGWIIEQEAKLSLG